MSTWFFVLTILFVVVSTSMVLIILVQRPSGGGLAGAFGGAGGGGTDSVFGGRVGDALTTVTIVAFLIYLGLSITLNLMPIRATPTAAVNNPGVVSPDPAGPATATPGTTPGTPGVTTGNGSTPLLITPLDGPPTGIDPNATPAPVTLPPEGGAEESTEDPGSTPDGGSE